jgi:predicted nucleic acid-binding protein
LSFLLDTSVLSEYTKPRPNVALHHWLGDVEPSALFLSVITVFEVRVGVESMAEGKRKQAIARWLTEDVATAYGGRLLPISAEIADRAAKLVVAARMKGWNELEMDALIAATALVHGFKVVTLNRKDFEKLGVELVRF